MALRVVQTNDQSHTVFDPVLNETYHSTHGAIQESRHVFIGAGLMHIVQKLNSISVLEIGFGTGLNALLTLMEAETLGKPVEYTAIEAFPLERDTWEQLNYPLRLCSIDYTAIFGKLHLAPWGMTEEISRYFRLHKIHQKLEDYSPPLECFDLVYFDAFSPATQPELWTACIFIKLYNTMKPGGILVTYSAKGEVRRAMKTAGFLVEKLPGPPGKRHILRATKNS